MLLLSFGCDRTCRPLAFDDVGDYCQGVADVHQCGKPSGNQEPIPFCTIFHGRRAGALERMYPRNEVASLEAIAQATSEFENAAMGALHVATGIGHIQLQPRLVGKLQLASENPGKL